MEGYHLYQMILVVLNIKNLSKIWLYAIGYGAPLIIFGFILLGIKPNNLKGEYLLVKFKFQNF